MKRPKGPVKAVRPDRLGVHRRLVVAGQVLLCACVSFGEQALPAAEDTPHFFGIRVVDDRTGRGVPLVELKTVNHLSWWTDSAGWAAIYEPGLMGREVFFHVRSHGYQYPRDGFGYEGLRLRLVPGQTKTVRIKRMNLAERLYRVTGEGIYRDSVLLGQPTPLQQPLGGAKVAGQDSVSVVEYRDRLFWFWGDTWRMSYPLGHFWMACATSQLPAQGGLDPLHGVNLDYLTDEDGFSRPVARLGVEQGVVWADGFLALPDDSGQPRLVCHYAHMESLDKMLGHGLAMFDDQTRQFRRLKVLKMEDRHLFPGQAHPIRHREAGVECLYFGEVFPNVRVTAAWQDYLDRKQYEVFTCLDGKDTNGVMKLLKDEMGNVQYRWQQGGRPIDSAMERRFVEAGKLTIDQAHFLPVDVDTKEPVVLHRGSVRWNAYRERWIMIATQIGGSSHLGEVWYAESPSLTGPWRRAKKIVTHEQYSFYNPVQHAFFDHEGGRVVYFEGTYSQTFSGNPHATPRYDYNQIMYRLDLSDPRLQTARSNVAAE